MDQNKLRTLVFEKTGVKVDSNDPIFALVALNEAVLAEAVERHVALLDQATKKLERELRHLPAGGPAKQVVRPKLMDDWEAGDEDDASAGQPAASMSTRAAASAAPLRPPVLLAAAAGIALLTALTMAGAQALFAKPAPVPAPVVQTPAAPAISAEQNAKLARADKLEQAIQKLDSKTRSKIDTELSKLAANP
ncbi:MAG TPA: hypothetical protein VIT92_11705 [Burkholderiaceae bacterium]